MKIAEQTVRRIEITDIPSLDPIRVMLEDIAPGKGRINIECYGESWASYWGGMDEQTIAQFFSSRDEHYLAGRLARVEQEVFDPEKLIKDLKSDVITERRRRLVSRDEARQLFSEIDSLALPDSLTGLWQMSGTMEELIGEEWWHRVPMKPNPDYVYLTRIVSVVQSALRSMEA